MGSRLANSWNLFKATLSVLAADKELAIYPVVSAIGVVLVTVAFAVPTFLSVLAAGQASVLTYIVGFLFYVVIYFVIIFANSALVGAAMIRLRGGDPTLSDGFRIAFSHVRVILGYSLIAATVGMILRWISERGAIGQIVKSILGAAWNITTYLVVPVLVVEDVGPADAIKRSLALLKRTWGEQLAGSLGMGLVNFLLFLLVLLVGGGILVLGVVLELGGLVIAGVVLWVLGFLALALLSATLGSIYSAAVYRYAAEGALAEQFPAGLVQGAFRSR